MKNSLNFVNTCLRVVDTRRVKREKQIPTKDPQYEWAVLISAQSSFPAMETERGVEKQIRVSDIAIKFPDSSQDIAQRVAKALVDAIGSCGGKRVKEIY